MRNLLNIRVPLKAERHAGLKQHKGEQMMREVSFWLSYSFKNPDRGLGET